MIDPNSIDLDDTQNIYIPFAAILFMSALSSILIGIGVLIGWWIWG